MLLLLQQNGHKVSFWHNIQCGNQAYYIHNFIQLQQIRMLLFTHIWSFPMTGEMFIEYNIYKNFQWLEIGINWLCLTCCIQTSQEEMNNNGKFNLCLYYEVLRGSNCVHFSWKSIWRNMVPKKVTFFLWKMWEKSWTGNNLVKKGKKNW